MIDIDDGEMKGLGFVIREVWAFICIHDDGDEAVPATFHDPSRTWLPMVAADVKRVESFREIAAEMAKRSGKRIVLAKFSTREDLETFEP